MTKLYRDRDWLYDKYINEQLSTTQIAKMLNVNHDTIWRWLKKFNIPTRPVINENPDVDDYFYEVMDGIMIGDGNLNISNGGKNVNFIIAQTKKQSEFIYWIAKFLNEYNIEYKLYKRERYKRDYIKKNGENGYTNSSLIIQTKCYELFNNIYHRHYNEKERLIPKDIKLTPLQLALWYISDGNLNYDKRKCAYQIRLSTHRYHINDLKWLVNEINDLHGIKFNIYRQCKNKENYGHILKIGKKNDIYNFCKIVEPYMCDCFKYKIRCLNDERWLSKL